MADGPRESVFDKTGLQEVASYMHSSADLRTRYPDEIEAIGYLLYHDETVDRKDLACAMLFLMENWSNACYDDDTCLPPPSRQMVADKDGRKILQAFQALQQAQSVSTE